jgi:transcriptional regulator with XRE-family HTH domain
MRRFGENVRQPRVAAGMSQRSLGRILRVSHSKIGRIERGHGTVDLLFAARLCAALGAEFSLDIHPVGSPVRDRGHLALLARFRMQVSSSLRWRTEVPLPIPGDRRTLDGYVVGDDFDGIVEAETRLDDLQALERRVHLKQRDSRARRAFVIASDTRHNRDVLASTPQFRERFPLSTRDMLRALRRGQDPGGDGIILL